MKLIRRLYFLFALTLIVGTATQAQNKEIAQKLSDPAKPGKLVVTLFNGSVKVVGYSGKEVIFIPSVTYDTNKIELSESANTVKLKVEKPHTINFVIKVPRNFSVVVKTQASGNITVENVSGDHEVYVPDGILTLTDIDGSVSASNVKGAVKVTMNSIKPGTPIAVSSVMGIVDVTIPAKHKANVSMQTTFGKLIPEFEIEKTGIEDAKNISGKINGGGADLLLKSVGGNVLLKKQP